MSVMRLELVEGTSRKFWEASTDGAKLVVRFGRIGSTGQTKIKVHASPAAAVAAHDKLVAEKLRKGYSGASTGGAKKAAAKSASAKPVKTAAPSRSAVAAVAKRIAELVPLWFAADEALGQSISEENDEEIEPAVPIEEALGAACSTAEIAALEKHLKRPLPTSYRAYLALHGKGEKRFGAPLGVAEHRSKELANAIKWKRSLFAEFSDGDPFAAGAIPFELDGDSRSMVLFVPPVRGDGDMAVVDYDITQESARYKDLAAYFQNHIKLALEIVETKAKRKKRGGVQSQRDAIDAVLATPLRPIAKSAIKTVALRLRGKLADGWVPTEAGIKDLKNGAESERFLAKLRAMPALLAEVALDLGDGAVALLNDKDQRAKAMPLVDLLGVCAPKKANDQQTSRWLHTMNSAIHRTYGAKQYELAAKLSDLAKPFVRSSKYIHHNAACAYVAVERYDDALAMCRIAVETKYSQLEQLRTDKDLGPLLRRREFKALFET